MKVIVYHTHYGCETGCCGHRIELQYPDETHHEAFEFEHWSGEGDPVEFAKRLITDQFGEEHVKDLDWENCRIESYKECVF
jgi:hypothetical protein